MWCRDSDQERTSFSAIGRMIMNRQKDLGLGGDWYTHTLRWFGNITSEEEAMALLEIALWKAMLSNEDETR